MANTLPFAYQVAAVASFLDGASNPALVSNITAVIDNPAVATVSIPAESGPVASVTAVITAVAMGTANLVITGTNPDGTTVSGTMEFSVVAGDAKSVVIVMGTPTPVV